MYKTIVLPVVYMGVISGVSPLGKIVDWVLWEQNIWIQFIW